MAHSVFRESGQRALPDNSVEPRHRGRKMGRGPRPVNRSVALCAAYWYPLYAFIRRRGHDAELAQDLTQDFFALILEKELLAKADPERGRFRSFLRWRVRRFLANSYERARTQKRGGGRPAVPFDLVAAEERTLEKLLTTRRRSESSTGAGADPASNRARTAEGEYDDAGRLETFDQLRDVLIDGPEAYRTRSSPGDLAAARGQCALRPPPAAPIRNPAAPGNRGNRGRPRRRRR